MFLDLLTFFSTIIQSLAWPIVAIIIILLLKKQIQDLIPGLRHLKYKEFEATFGGKIAEVEQRLEKAFPEIDMGKDKSDLELSEIERLHRLINISPRATILEAWIILENALRSIAVSKDIKEGNRIPIMHLNKKLLNKNIVSEEVFSIIEVLRRLRNEAAHTKNFNLNTELLEDYIDAIWRIANALRLGQSNPFNIRESL